MPRSAARDKDGLNVRQRAFVHAYVGKANGNGKEAARMAGYLGNDATLKVNASKMLHNPDIAAAIRALTARAEEADIVDVIEAKRILSEIARDVGQESKDRISALDKLLKSGGAYVINHNVEHKGAAVHVYIPSNGRD
jgi:hypothetical protein